MFLGLDDIAICYPSEREMITGFMGYQDDRIRQGIPRDLGNGILWNSILLLYDIHL